MKIMCNIITGAIKDLARQIGRSESYTCNLVSVWQTQNNSAEYPTASQLNELLKSNKEQAWDAYLAVPNYEVREYNPNVVPIEHVNGQIYLMRLPKDKPMEHFYKMYKHLPELRELAVTPEEAYRFILWREMAFMQYGLDKKVENRPVAEGEAIKKAKEWRKRHPVQRNTAPKLSFEQVLNRVRDWYRWQREHITFDEASHTYAIDGNPVDYSVTQYGESVYGAPNIQGDYSFTQAIGRSVDALTRDFFLRDEDPTQKDYPNLSEHRKKAILADLERLKAHLDKEFNGNYQVITAEFPIAARIATKDGDKTIAGTMDMLILDGDGNLHIFDMKTKNHPIDQKYNGVEVNDRRNYTFQLNSYRQILETIFPEFKGRIQDLRLIWFDQSYPRQGKEATFVTGEGGVVTVSDSEVQNQPLQDYYKWLTPALKSNVQESLISLKIQSPLEGIRPIQENWATTSPVQPAPQQFVLQTLTITPAQSVDKKATAKGSISNKFIGFAEGISNSSTADYAKQAGDRANVGIYSPEDTVFVSIPGMRGSAEIRHREQQRTIDEALKALRQGATLITDNEAYTSSSSYNEGEKKLAQALKSAGAIYSERTVDGQVLGVWHLPTNQQQNVAPQQKVAKSFSAEEAAATPAPQVVTQEDTENVYKVPEIGSKVLRVDPNNPVAKLARDFTAIERHDRVVMLARNFSNIVDRAVEEKIQENADAITAEMGKDEPDRAELARLYERALLLNDSVKGRRAVMQDKTVQQIFKEMREEIESYMEMTPEELDEDYGEGQGEYMLQAYQKVLDNWYELLKEACILIEGTENVRVVIDRHDYNNGTTTETVTGGIITDSSQDEDTNESEFNDDEDGNRVDGNGGWSFKVRFVDPRTSLSRGVKRVLSGIKKEGINGEPEVDDLGNIRYVNEEFAHAALINELSGMIDPNDFSVKNDDGTYSFPALEKVTEKYPWANQVINALKAEPSLISSFYADFRKDFIPYWMQYFDKKDDKWKTHAMNQAVALDSTKTSIINNYEQGTILDENSIYAGGRKLITTNAELGINLANEILSLLREFDEDDYEELTEKVARGLKMVGLNANARVISNLLKSENGIVNLEKVINAMKNIFSGIEGMPENAHLIEAFSDDYNTIAQEVGLVSELDNIQSFRNGDKTYYSYSAPNYLDTMFKIFKNDERRDAYLQEQFGKYSWFKKNGQWRNEWLKLIESDEDVRHQMQYKELLVIKDPQQDPKEQHTEYVNWTPLQIKAAFVREYFSVGYNKGSKKQFAWYNMPIFSDSPVVKFIKFLRYTGDFKGQLTPLFNKVVKQELSRIRLVQDRKKAGVAPIANFDKNGDRFHFFPELNSYHDGHFLEEVMTLTEAKDLDGLNKLINDAVTEIMNQNFTNFLNSNFSRSSYMELGESLLTDGVITSEIQFDNALEEYFWNQAYATSQIIQLTTTDLAYYKDGTDFQKRYKEVYAAGTKLNTNSQYGREIERTIYLADQIITSAAYTDIRRSLNRAVQLGHIQPFDRDNILNKFKDINVADAQAYRSLSSMRAVLDMMGAWTPEMQQAMDRFDNGEWDMADFNIVWQTIKPFVFTQIKKPDGLDGSIKVPHQNKNSEFLLLSMYQMVAGSMNRSPKLKALNRFMEDKEIDVIQFESAVKVGKQGTIDINYSEPKFQVWKMNHEKEWKEIEKAAKTSGSDYSVFKAGNDYLLDHDMISQEEYNDRFEAIEPTEQEVYDLLESLSMQNGEFKSEVVHEIPYSDYIIQQPTPEHLFDRVAVFGSQFRNLIISDMPDDPDFRIKVNGRSLTKQQVLDLYQANIVENLLEDWEKVKGKFADIRSLQKAMLDAVKGNPKYGRDMLDALQIVEIVNPNTGEKQEAFNIPLDNPSTTTKIQELITSMFKNAITKQSIKGASCILVSDFGLTKELNILHGEDGSIQGIECYLPAYSKQFYEPFAVTKIDDAGNEYQELDVTKMPMELRRIIGYRIPTEDKYSMAPLIIKGFLPQQNGSSIMLPADITQIAGSDFDVDKMYLMIPEFIRRDKYAIKAAWDTFYQEHPEITSQIEAAQWATFVDSYNELLKKNPKEAEEIDVEDEAFKNWFVKESKLKNYEWVEGVQDAFAKWFKTNKQRFFQGTKITKVEYDESKSPQEQSRAARNNMIIDVAWGILTNPDTAEKIHNPGSFDKAKIAARIATIISDPALLNNFAGEHGLMYQMGDNDYKYNPKEVAQLLLGISKEGRLDELDKFIKKYKVERSQLTVDTFIYNHKQNMTGSMLIGMYANNTAMQAKFQVTGLAIKDDYIFTINGRTVQSLHDIMSPNGDRISKNCANFLAASVDNAKDPVLADLMQNTQTANIAGFMLRAGMSVEEIGLLFSQPLVRRCITETGGLKKLGSYVKSMIRTLRENGGGVDDKIQLHDFTSEELILNAINEARTSEMTQEELNNHLASQIQAGLLMVHISKIAQDLSDLTQIARADSPNGAISISIAGAKNQTRKVDLYARRAKTKRFTLTGLGDIMQNKYVTANMSREQMREKFLKSKMPMLQTFYSLGIELGSQVMGQYFSQTTAYSDALVEQLYDNSPTGVISDDTLNSFYSELVEFALSRTKMLGNDNNATFDEKRDYYLYDFPKEYLGILAANPDIANMSIFRKMQVKDGNIVMGRSGKLTSMMRETLMRDFDMLLYMDNPAAQKLAVDLFMYSYYKDGFKFGPNSFGTFFSSNFISSFPEFVGALRELRFGMQSGTYFDNFLPQFYANHWQELVPQLDESTADVVETSDGQIGVNSKQVLNRNLLGLNQTKSYPLIGYNGQLYALTLDGSDRAIYTPTVSITSTQKGKRGVKYNANMTIQEMASIETDEARVKANEQLNPSDNSRSVSEDELFKALEDGFGGFEGMDDALAGLEETYGEALGEAELNEPMCK